MRLAPGGDVARRELRRPRARAGGALTTARAGALLAAGVVLAGLNLRIAVASLPPLVDEIREDLGLSAAAAGLLTSVPVLCFGALAPVAPALTRRLGAEGALLLALVPIVVGVVARGVASTPTLFAGTALAGAGIAIGNVVVPAVIKGAFAERGGTLIGVYAAALGAGAATAAAATVPLEHLLGGSWGAALAVWAVPAVVAAAVLSLALGRSTVPATARGGAAAGAALLRHPVAWQVTLFMGLQSLVFYSGLAWVPSVLRDHGYSAAEAGAALSLYAVTGLPASVVVGVLAGRSRDQRALAAVTTGIEALGVAGLLFAPGAAFLWVAVFGIGQGAAFSLALTLIVLRAGDARTSVALSGMAQSIGYAIAAAGPALVGGVHDAVGSWRLPLAILLGFAVLLIGAGFAAGRERLVSLEPL